MVRVDNIRQRMQACTAKIDGNLAAYRAARSEQIRTFEELGNSIDALESSVAQYARKMERNRAGIARTNVLARRLEEILGGIT